jgi:hypothetical protein
MMCPFRSEYSDPSETVMVSPVARAPVITLAMVRRYVDVTEERIRRLEIRLAASQSQSIPVSISGRRWSAEEDECARTLSPSEASRKTGRSKNAVALRRRRLMTAKGDSGSAADPSTSPE